MLLTLKYWKLRHVYVREDNSLFVDVFILLLVNAYCFFFFLSFYTLQKFVSQVVKSTISDDCEIVGQSHQLGYTPAKRNLVEELDEVAVPDSTLKLKAVKVEIE